jgi:hypothetical protein
MASDVPPGYLPPSQIFHMLAEDFRSAWDALAAIPEQGAGADGRGNFVFTLMAMVLLEFASRIAKTDPTGALLQNFTRMLKMRDPRYFLPIPDAVPISSQFVLPHDPSRPQDEQLLALLFDLLRHGHAHQYHQVPAELSDGRTLLIALAGAPYGQRLGDTFKHGRPDAHLRIERLARTGNLRLVLLPNVLFEDLHFAARPVFSNAPEPQWLRKRYLFSSKDFAAAFGLTGEAP